MQDISLTDGVVAEEPQGFVSSLCFWCVRSRPFFNSKELVIEYPFGTNLMVCFTPHHLSGKIPASRHVVRQFAPIVG